MDPETKRVLDAMISKLNANTDALREMGEKLNKHSDGFGVLRNAFLQLNTQLRMLVERVATLETVMEPKTRKRTKKKEASNGTENSGETVQD